MSQKERDDLPLLIREILAAEAGAGPAEQRQMEELMAAIGGALPPVAPREGARDRLLAAATAGPARYAPFFDRVGALFDLGAEAVVRVFARAADAAEWVPGPAAGIRLLHLDGGPALAGADTGLVRMEAGLAWPRHRHLGFERVLILEGSYRDDTGREYHAGHAHEMLAGTEHSFTVSPEGPLVFALALSAAGVELLGPS